MRKTLVLGGLTTLLVAALAQPAGASTWSGRCEQKGYMDVFPPRKVVPYPSGFGIVSIGHCRGVLDGEPFDGQASFFAHADMKSPMGCVVGVSHRGNPAYVRFARGRLDALGPPPEPQAQATKGKKKKKKKKPPPDPRDVQLDVFVTAANITPRLLPIDIEGVYRGHSFGTVRFLTPQSELVEKAVACTGEGVGGHIPIEFEFDTVQELYG